MSAMVPRRVEGDRRAGPAVAELDAFLRAHRRRLPPILRASLIAGLTAFLVYAVLLVLLAVEAPGLAGVLAVFLFLVMVGGREPAILLAFQELGDEALVWVAGVAVLGDVGIVLVGIPFYWWALERLRETPGFRGLLLDIEQRAFESRHHVARWGPVALALFVLVPAWGTGPLVAGAVGLIARVPLRSLMPVLVVAVTVVNVTWALILAHTHEVIPAVGAWRLLPLGIIVVLIAAGIASGVRRRRRHEVVIALEDTGAVASERLELLGSLSTRRARGLLYLDCDALAARLGLAKTRPEECRAVAELLLLASVAPEEAPVLRAAGIQTIRDLAVAPPGLVARAVAETRPAHPTDWGEHALRWHDEARAFTSPPAVQAA